MIKNRLYRMMYIWRKEIIMVFRNRGRERKACPLLIHKVIILYPEMKLKLSESLWVSIYYLKKLVIFLQLDKMQENLQLNLKIIDKAI